MLVEELADTCPECGARLSQRRTQEPWCGSCEWNLETYQPDGELPRGVRMLLQFSHRTGYRLDKALYAELAGESVDRPGMTPARVLLLVVSLVLFALLAVAAVFGTWLVVADFPSFTIVPGLLLLLVAWGLRPRLGRLRTDWGVLTAEDAPRLHALINKVAAGVGTRPPDVVIVESEFNASAGAAGFRRRRVLRLGMALWGALTDGERVALLAHEFGHFGNGDPARSLATRPAVTVFGELAEILRPHPSMASQLNGLVDILAKIAYVIFKPVLWALSRLMLTIHVGLLAVAMRDRHRAEYLADATAARVAGTKATVSTLDALVIAPSIVDALRNAERSPDTKKRSWRTAADAVRAECAAEMPMLRQFSMREDASLFAAHPPTGYRARMIESRPQHEPTVVLSEEDSAAIDRELAKWYVRAGRDLAQ